MGDISGPLAYLLLTWGLITAALVVLLVYRATLSTKEDDQLYLNKAEVSMMGTDQAVLITRLNRLTKPILALAILSGILLLVSASLWVWIGFNNP
jgi:cell division protein FtsL